MNVTNEMQHHKTPPGAVIREIRPFVQFVFFLGIHLDLFYASGFCPPESRNMTAMRTATPFVT